MQLATFISYLNPKQYTLQLSEYKKWLNQIEIDTYLLRWWLWEPLQWTDIRSGTCRSSSTQTYCRLAVQQLVQSTI